MRNFIAVPIVYSLVCLSPAVAGAAEATSPQISRLFNSDQEHRYTPVPGRRLAVGDECPNLSGSYCPDEFPVCCMVSGEWGCYAKLDDCKEK
jgi:hypothetical protein